MHENDLRRLIEAKRDGARIEPAAWSAVMNALARGRADEAQVAALAMACVLRGLDFDETLGLTAALVASGEVLELDLGRDVLDKHSSGGVGDTVSLIAVPVVAAGGVPVAKLSGRALGHTGGTLDKLEAIPGVWTDHEPAQLLAGLRRAGCAIAAQSARLVPADKKLYALRDRTGTVPGIGLIAASIVSKKIAGGAHAIVYDVKVGRGAFMTDAARASELGHLLVGLTQRLGRRSRALVTDMDEPLSPAVGDALEAVEARDFLRGDRRDARLLGVLGPLCAHMLELGGVAEPEAAFENALASGAAYRTFVAMIEAQGGTRAALESLAPLPAPHDVLARTSGYVQSIDAVAVGELVRELILENGSGAGVRLAARVGDKVESGQRVALVHGGDTRAVTRLRAAFSLGPDQPLRRPLVFEVIGAASVGPRPSSSAIK